MHWIFALLLSAPLCSVSWLRWQRVVVRNERKKNAIAMHTGTRKQATWQKIPRVYFFYSARNKQFSVDNPSQVVIFSRGKINFTLALLALCSPSHKWQSWRWKEGIKYTLHYYCCCAAGAIGFTKKIFLQSKMTTESATFSYRLTFFRVVAALTLLIFYPSFILIHLAHTTTTITPLYLLFLSR